MAVSERACDSRGRIPQGLKPQKLRCFSARLKPCPDDGEKPKSRQGCRRYQDAYGFSLGLRFTLEDIDFIFHFFEDVAFDDEERGKDVHSEH
jgi:hypothetical protein